MINFAFLGWDEGWQQLWDQIYGEDKKDLTPGRVMTVQRNVFRVVHPEGEGALPLSGRLLREAKVGGLHPAVGDFVAVRLAQGGGVIEAILPRRTSFSRPDAFAADGMQTLCVNIDALFIVQALGHDYNPRRMERYVTAAWDSGATPVLVLNKSDVVEDAAPFVDEMANLAPGVQVVAVSALTGAGMESLRDLCPAGRTCGFLGSSGVGKSTLINALAGREVASTGEVREDDERGRHTTTYRELHRMPWGALLIDTPGMREFGLRMGDADAVFAEVAALAKGCRFADCRHDREPGCAVRDAVRAGLLDPKRLESYRTLSREVARMERYEARRRKIADNVALNLTDKSYLRKQPAPDNGEE